MRIIKRFYTPREVAAGIAELATGGRYCTVETAVDICQTHLLEL